MVAERHLGTRPASLSAVFPLLYVVLAIPAGVVLSWYSSTVNARYCARNVSRAPASSSKSCTAP